jgi:hypothetical protein
MDLKDIIAIEGIVIRRIPSQTTSLFGYRETFPMKAGDEVVMINDRRYVRRVKDNSLGGKYLVTMKQDQDSIVRFDIKHNGIGDTVEAAFADLRKKGKHNDL